MPTRLRNAKNKCRDRMIKMGHTPEEYFHRCENILTHELYENKAYNQCEVCERKIYVHVVAPDIIDIFGDAINHACFRYDLMGLIPCQ